MGIDDVSLLLWGSGLGLGNCVIDSSPRVRLIVACFCAARPLLSRTDDAFIKRKRKLKTLAARIYTFSPEKKNSLPSTNP